MKKIISFLVAVVLTAPLFAQTKSWKIALHIDPNVSWIKPDSKHLTAGDNRLNFGFGVSIDKMFTDNYAIGTGFNVLNLGGQLTYFDELTGPANERTIAKVKRAYKLKYAEIPVTLKLRTNEIGYITYWAQVGVGIGVNIKAKADDIVDYRKQAIDSSTVTVRWDDVGPTEIIDEDNPDEDIADAIALPRASLIIGGGIEYNLSGDASIVAGLLFNNAFTNILNGNGVENSNDEPVINTSDKTAKSFDLKGISNAISLQIGFLF
jgi:hypothetical protein